MGDPRGLYTLPCVNCREKTRYPFLIKALYLILRQVAPYESELIEALCLIVIAALYFILIAALYLNSNSGALFKF